MMAVHCFVSGRVQGVFFRDSTARKAQELGLRGWVRNLRNGGVEVYAVGDEPELEQMQAWLKSGPPMAEVDALDCQIEAQSTEVFHDFRIVR